MIADIVEFAQTRWETWLGEPAPAVIRSACARGGGAHPFRGLVLLFAGDATEPSVVLKIAFSDGEARFLKREFDNLTELRRGTQSALVRAIPSPYGWEPLNDAHVMSMSAVRGRRILYPYLPSGSSIVAKRILGRFIRRTFAWSRELAAVEGRGVEGSGRALADLVRVFARSFVKERQPLDRVLSFADHLAGERTRTWVRGWQHGATDITNALTWKGEIRFVDWEHAAPDADPWFDVAYAPLALGRLGARQAPSRPEEQVFVELLRSDGWTGGALRAAMEEAWEFPVPLSTAVVLAAIEVTLRRERPSRPWAADLAVGLLADSWLRRELRWLAPRW